MATKTHDRIGDYKLGRKVTIDVIIDSNIDVQHMRQAVMDALTYADNVSFDEDILLGMILSQIEIQLK